MNHRKFVMILGLILSFSIMMGGLTTNAGTGPGGTNDPSEPDIVYAAEVGSGYCTDVSGTCVEGIQNAVDKVGNGGTVYVLPGTYDGWHTSEAQCSNEPCFGSGPKPVKVEHTSLEGKTGPSLITGADDTMDNVGAIGINLHYVGSPGLMPSSNNNVNGLRINLSESDYEQNTIGIYIYGNSNKLTTNMVYDNFGGVLLENSDENQIGEEKETALPDDFNPEDVIGSEDVNFETIKDHFSNILLGNINPHLDDPETDPTFDPTDQSSGNYGIKLLTSKDNNIQNNLIAGYIQVDDGGGGGGGIASADTGVVLENSASNNIIGNYIVLNSDGIKVGPHPEGSDGNVIRNNFIARNGFYYDQENSDGPFVWVPGMGNGIELRNSDNNTLSGNEITQNAIQGIYLDRSTGNTIGRVQEKGYSGNEIYENTTGIYFMNSNYNEIIGNEIYDNYTKCIYFHGSDNNIIEENLIYDNEDQGIFFWGGKSNKVLNNEVYFNSTGIQFGASHKAGGEKNYISGNKVYGNTSTGIELNYANSNEILDNLLYKNFGGLLLKNADGNQIGEGKDGAPISDFSPEDVIGSENVEFETIKDHFSNILLGNINPEERSFDIGYSGNYGIKILSAKDNNIRNNLIAGYVSLEEQQPLSVEPTMTVVLGTGIQLNDSESNSIIGNGIVLNDNGIRLKNSTNNEIRNNFIARNGFYYDLREKEFVGTVGSGINFRGSNSNIVTGNEIAKNCTNGIILHDSNNNKIGGNQGDGSLGNEIYGNGESGISLWRSSNQNEILGNDIHDNLNGIKFNSSNNNLIEYNFIHDNEKGIYFSGADNNVILNDEIYSNSTGIQLGASNLASGGTENSIVGNNIYGNNTGIQIYTVSPGNSIHYNSIHDNTDFGVDSEARVDAALNWWGDPTGPSGEGEGDGDAVSENVIFSPWLFEDPDTGYENAKPGVQLPNSLEFMVDDVGPKPEGGYLQTALDAANSPLLPGQDTIYIRSDEEDNNYKPVVDEGTIGTKIVILSGGSSLDFNRNIIDGKVVHQGQETADFSFNHWGSPPHSHISGKTSNMLLTPWLEEPPGTEPMTYKVADLGADPEGGITRALADANTDTFEDTIIVDEGTYNVSDSTGVTEPADVVSCTGCPTAASINGGLVVESSEVHVGGWDTETYPKEGLNINADVTVRSDVDASEVQINWNNIYGTVTNEANGTLDATYNWWGDDNPDNSTVGKVDYDPYLPDTVCAVIEYMKEHEITDPESAVVGMVVENSSPSEQAAAEVTEMGLTPEQADELLDEYGRSQVLNALENADTSGEFVQLLNGFRLPAGAAGGLTNNIVAGGAGSVGGKTVGAVFTKCETIKVSFPLADFEGNPTKHLTPTVSLVELDEDGNKKGLEKVTTATYEEDSSAYVATFSSCELSPGYYQVHIDLVDGSALTQVIQVKEKEE